MRLDPINPAFLTLQAETGKALDCLARVQLTDEDVHGARKALKKARAALRLLRPVLGDADYRATNTLLRDAARCLSPLRDAAVLLHALDALGKDTTDEPSRNAVAAMHRSLTAAWFAAREEVTTLELRRRCAVLIETCRQRVARQAVAQAGAAVLRSGYGAIYRKARKAFGRARRNTNAAALHEWRKQTKYLHNAAAALHEARAGGVRKTEEATRDLAEWLGDDHDLAVLGDMIRASTGVNPGDADALLHRIVRRRAKLQQRALAAGAGLFAAKPSRFVVDVASAPQRSRLPARALAAAPVGSLREAS